MHYFIGDIHGYVHKLISLLTLLNKELKNDDIIVFLGDYIDRGPNSFEVIEFLINYAQNHQAIFLKGNHEDMFLRFLNKEDISEIYLINGGRETIKSYERNCGELKLPEKHQEFFNNLKLYYEGDDFIAVHAGLDPIIEKAEDQKEHDLMWIRDKFFRSGKKWEKTVIFGHTPTPLISGERKIFTDDEKNIIAIDSGVIYGGPISCIRWPDKAVFESFTYEE